MGAKEDAEGTASLLNALALVAGERNLPERSREYSQAAEVVSGLARSLSGEATEAEAGAVDAMWKRGMGRTLLADALLRSADACADAERAEGLRNAAKAAQWSAL